MRTSTVKLIALSAGGAVLLTVLVAVVLRSLPQPQPPSREVAEGVKSSGDLNTASRGKGVKVEPAHGSAGTTQAGSARSEVSAGAVPAPVAAFDVIPENAPAEPWFESGRQLVERNSGEALGSSREELDEGVRRVERALRSGLSDDRKAYAVLAHAYNAVRARASVSEAEALSFLQKEGTAYQRLAAIEPGNPEWLLLHAGTVVDPAAQLLALRRLAEKHPRYAPARKLLAARLCEQGRGTEGLGHAIAATKNVAQGAVEAERPELVSLAWRCAGEAGAEQVRQILEERARR